MSQHIESPQALRASLNSSVRKLQLASLDIAIPEIVDAMNRCEFNPGRILSTLAFHNATCGQCTRLLVQHFSEYAFEPLPIIRGDSVHTTSDCGLMITTFVDFATICHTLDQFIPVYWFLIQNYIHHAGDSSSSPQCPAHGGE